MPKQFQNIYFNEIIFRNFIYLNSNQVRLHKHFRSTNLLPLYEEINKKGHSKVMLLLF